MGNRNFNGEMQRCQDNPLNPFGSTFVTIVCRLTSWLKRPALTTRTTTVDHGGPAVLYGAGSSLDQVLLQGIVSYYAQVWRDCINQNHSNCRAIPTHHRAPSIRPIRYISQSCSIAANG